MKRIMFLLCVVFLISGCVPKASQFSLDNERGEIQKASERRGRAFAEQAKVQANVFGRNLTQPQISAAVESESVTASEAQGDAEKGREKAHADCMVTAHTSFAVMLADIISILSGEVLWGDLVSKLATTTFNQATFSDPLKLRTTKEVVNTCLKSKGFPPIEGQDGSSKPAAGSPPPAAGNSQPSPRRGSEPPPKSQ